MRSTARSTRSCRYDPVQGLHADRAGRERPGCRGRESGGPVIESVDDLIAHAKANPGKLNFGIGRQRHAGPPHRRDVRDGGRRQAPARALQGQRPGDHRPARRADPADVRSAAVGDASKCGPASCALLGDQQPRCVPPPLPDVPTLDEAGLKGFESTAWWAVFAPANLPADVADASCSAEIERVVRSDAFKREAR